MSLSYDLISEFVKITNDKKDDKKEGIVYATVVSGTEGKYVRIDGSDLLTPMDTTSDIEDGERVTLMIKEHKAIVTGNVTNPSASTTKVDKVSKSVNSISDRVGTFELVVADKVSTKELEAYKATIEVLIANKATIEDLTATNATIENLNADFAQIKTLVNGNLTSDNILSFNLTSGKVTVDDAFIKDAMIDTISAGKINAGEINTNLVSIGSEDGGMLITGSTQQFTDKNGNVRIQIGKDASGDFTFILYGEDGRGQLINQNGITASAISDGLIVNDMVSDHAAISGGKLDISSVITEINGDTSTTIKSSKIYLNEQAQSLEVAFNSLKTKVDAIQEVTIQGDLTAIVEQVQSNTSKIEVNKESINTLISQDTVIKKQVTDLQGTVAKNEETLSAKYTSLSQNLDGFKTTVADTYATKSSVTDVVDNIEANYSTTSVMNSAIEQKAQEISASVSSTYATKNQVNTLDNNLKSNYSTTQQMESAINVAKEEINLGVSSIYETKTNVESKVNGIQIGGRNLARQSNRFYNGIGGSGITSEVYNDGSLSVTAESINDGWYKLGVITSEGIEDRFNEGDDFTISFIASSYDTTTIPYIFIKEGMGYARMEGTLTSNDSMIYYSGKWKKNNSIYLHLGFYGMAGTITFKKWKIEKGNKPTDWTPAPEDIENDISSLEYETKTIKENMTSLTLDNNSINASVKALQETVTKTADGLANDIASVQNQVNMTMTSEDVKLEIQKEMSKGTNKVATSTGFTFDQNGLNVSKTDSEMKTQITEDGMKIYKNDDVMLTANNQGVDAKNLHATTYLIIGGNSRMEDIIEHGTKRTAIFWIGQS